MCDGVAAECHSFVPYQPVVVAKSCMDNGMVAISQ
jgi:hypothetical protein